MEMKSSGKESEKRERKGDEKIYAALSWRQTLQHKETIFLPRNKEPFLTWA